MTRHELFDELDAFDPRWRQNYGTLRAAAIVADVEALYDDYVKCTPDGQTHLARFGGVPDYANAAKRVQEAESSLPYNLDNIGTVAIPAEQGDSDDED